MGLLIYKFITLTCCFQWCYYGIVLPLVVGSHRPGNRQSQENPKLPQASVPKTQHHQPELTWEREARLIKGCWGPKQKQVELIWSKQKQAEHSKERGGQSKHEGSCCAGFSERRSCARDKTDRLTGLTKLKDWGAERPTKQTRLTDWRG